MNPSNLPKHLLRSNRHSMKLVASCRITPISLKKSSLHTTSFNFDKNPIEFDKSELKKEDKTERKEEIKQTLEDTLDTRSVQDHINIVKESELKTVKGSGSDVNEVKVNDLIDDVLADMNLDLKKSSSTTSPTIPEGKSRSASQRNFASKERGSSPKRVDEETYRKATQTKFATHGSISLEGRHIADKIKNHPRYNYEQFKKFETETESQVLSRLLQKFETAKRKYDEKRMAFYMKNKTEQEEGKKSKSKIPITGWEDIAISNIIEFEAKLKTKHGSKPIKVQDILYKDAITNEDKASVTLLKNINTDMIPRVNPLLSQEYQAIPYMSKDTIKEMKTKLESHSKSNDPLPEDLAPFKTIIEAKGEKLRQLQDQQYLNKLVPASTRPLHLWEDISSTQIGKFRSQWKKKRFILRNILRDRQRDLIQLSKAPLPQDSIDSLELRWRAVYQFYLKKLRDEIKPDGDWKVARENYRKIRSIFINHANLNEAREHIELYLLGHAKYWDWTKARDIFMKTYKTLWNIHPEIRDKSLTPVFIMMRGLAYRKRSFSELLAMHSLVADEAANGLLFEQPLPPKWYYDSVLRCLIEEENWDLAKQWFTHFYQSTLYSRSPSSTAHVLPDTETYTLLLRGARLIPRVASIESHLIFDAARRDSIQWNSTFTPTSGMIKEVLEAHIQDGDGAGAVVVFKKSFDTPISTGLLDLTKLDREQQKELYFLYFRALGQTKNLNEIYASLIALYRFDDAWIQDTTFHNRILEDLSNLNYSMGIHFLKNIYKVRGKVHINPVHPDFYTFESAMQRAVKTKRFMFARGILNLTPPMIRGHALEKLTNMSQLALRSASQKDLIEETI